MITLVNSCKKKAKKANQSYQNGWKKNLRKAKERATEPRTDYISLEPTIEGVHFGNHCNHWTDLDSKHYGNLSHRIAVQFSQVKFSNSTLWMIHLFFGAIFINHGVYSPELWCVIYGFSGWIPYSQTIFFSCLSSCEFFSLEVSCFEFNFLL